MDATTTWSARVLFVSAGVLLVSGLLVWIGFPVLIGAHQLVGYALIASLWTLAFVAARRGVPMGVVVGAVAWGLLVLALGWGQRYILLGSSHWIVQVLHLAISMASMAWGRWLLASIRQRRVVSLHPAAYASERS
ncbi:MAG TPA: hypothetical protein VFP83_08015 [Candidatus Limnocylindria bacterium]|nr:hypothetical protein [Candidatus Limnocylindria bacterium]